jgi:hypothetical protein
MAQLAHDELAPMALGYIQAWLADDYWTVAKIGAEVSGADPELVAETFSLAAAALLVQAFDGNAVKAAALARKACSERVGGYARHAA